MPVKVIGVSLEPQTLATLDELAQHEGVSRSAFVGRLVDGEVARRLAARRNGGPLVEVDGVRFVPERKGRARG